MCQSYKGLPISRLLGFLNYRLFDTGHRPGEMDAGIDHKKATV